MAPMLMISSTLPHRSESPTLQIDVRDGLPVALREAWVSAVAEALAAAMIGMLIEDIFEVVYVERLLRLCVGG